MPDLPKWPDAGSTRSGDEMLYVYLEMHKNLFRSFCKVAGGLSSLRLLMQALSTGIHVDTAQYTGRLNIKCPTQFLNNR